jgi:hypothetical protein
LTTVAETAHPPHLVDTGAGTQTKKRLSHAEAEALGAHAAALRALLAPAAQCNAAAPLSELYVRVGAAQARDALPPAFFAFPAAFGSSRPCLVFSDKAIFGVV